MSRLIPDVLILFVPLPRVLNLIQAGLLTPGSFSSCAFPSVTTDSGIMQESSPVTAAGPSRIYTGFPFHP